jgi:hypothetical protein
VLALTFDKRLEPREARQLVLAGRMQPQFHVVDAFFREHLAELLARFPDNGNAGPVGLAITFLRGCDPAHREEAASFVKQQFAKYPGSPRVIARGLEGYDQCIAARSLLGPKIEAWLAKTR